MASEVGHARLPHSLSAASRVYRTCCFKPGHDERRSPYFRSSSAAVRSPSGGWPLGATAVLADAQAASAAGSRGRRTGSAGATAGRAIFRRRHGQEGRARDHSSRCVRPGQVCARRRYRVRLEGRADRTPPVDSVARWSLRDVHAVRPRKTTGTAITIQRERQPPPDRTCPGGQCGGCLAVASR